MNPIIKEVQIVCENISKHYSGKTIFRDLSFKISSQQSLSITGRNGSGKTTLIKILSNLTSLSAGNLIIKENNDNIPRENWFHKIGLFSPYMNLYDELTGIENLNFFYKLKLCYYNGLKHNTSDRINFLLESVNLHESKNDLVKNYSTGMKQRLKLVFAIMNEPEILLMDEPRTNLDRFGIDYVHKVAEEYKNKGILIIATNDEADRKLCDESINIEDYK